MGNHTVLAVEESSVNPGMTEVAGIQIQFPFTLFGELEVGGEDD